MKRHVKTLLVGLALGAVPSVQAMVQTGGLVQLRMAALLGASASNAAGGGLRLRASLGRSSAVAPGAHVVAAAPAPTSGGSAADLGAAHAFPVPYKPSAGHDRITFRGLTADATVRVYTLSGRLIQTLTKSDSSTADLVWMPVVDAWGSPLASGVYLYTIDGDSCRKTGKLMVIK